MSKGPRWSEDEANFIRDNYEHTPIREVSKVLGRTTIAVQKMAAKLGVRKVIRSPVGSYGGKAPRAIGSTRVDANGYTHVKFGKGDWRLLQRVKWEEYYGEPPKGTVAFRDGNRANVEKSNLYLTSPREQLKNNSANNLPEGLRELVHMKGRLTFMINKRREE